MNKRINSAVSILVIVLALVVAAGFVRVARGPFGTSVVWKERWSMTGTFVDIGQQ